MGLRAIWERFEYFGTPEVMKSSLFRRLESFPKIQNKNGHKLRELGNLLMEIQADKTDGVLLGLSYLDTPCGINPMVQKLPFCLQEKWLTVGFKYQGHHHVLYPLFSFFVNCVRNDPGFMLAASSNESLGHQKPLSKPDSQRAVAVLKTGVSPNTPPVSTDTSPASKQRRPSQTLSAA